MNCYLFCINKTVALLALKKKRKLEGKHTRCQTDGRDLRRATDRQPAMLLMSCVEAECTSRPVPVRKGAFLC